MVRNKQKQNGKDEKKPGRKLSIWRFDQDSHPEDTAL